MVSTRGAALPMHARSLLTRPQLVAAFVVFIVLAAVGFLPLFGGPGYEQSLASGLVIPAAAAIETAIELSALNLAPLTGIARGVWSGAALAGVAFSTALLHGLRVGICDLSGGATYFALTAGIGAIIGGILFGTLSELQGYCSFMPSASRF